MSDNTYFRELSKALTDAGVVRPALVIDLDRLNANIAAVKNKLPSGLGLRIVDKSLPSLPLIGHIMNAFESRQIMSFHLPVTLAVLKEFPDAEILYGKPMPIAVLAHALKTLADDMRQRLLEQTVWLIDTTARLEQYGELAKRENVTLRYALEVDTGMHRGGFETPDALSRALAEARNFPTLRCEGIMGYEAHIAEIPSLFGGPGFEQRKVKERLARYSAVLPQESRTIINTGGSKTATTYQTGDPASEVSMGSGFLMPTDFDVDALAALKPAAFIATPVLKVVDAKLPGPSFVTKLLQALGQFPRRGCFIYGGKWYAEPAWPAGMKDNKIWGHSSNQQLMTLPQNADINVDDLVFFRPTQSEAVLQHFGPLAVYSRGRIIEEWPVLPTG